MFSQNLMPILLSLQGFLDPKINVNVNVGEIIAYIVLLLGLIFIGIVTSKSHPRTTAIGGFALVVIGLFKISPLLAVILAGCGILVIAIILVDKFDNVEEKTNTTSSQTNTNTSSKPAEAFIKGVLSGSATGGITGKITEIATHLSENGKVETPSILSATLAERASNPINKEENTNKEVNEQKP
jgi:hypothetical protein